MVSFGEVPNGPIAQAALRKVESGEMTWSDICRSLGWVDKNNGADTSRLRRRLGLVGQTKGGGSRNRKELRLMTGMRYETAVEIVRALGLDPVDFDL